MVKYTISWSAKNSNRVKLKVTSNKSDDRMCSLVNGVKVKVEHLLQRPFVGTAHCRGAQVHGAHQAASHIPALYLPSRSRYSFTDPERMEG